MCSARTVKPEKKKTEGGYLRYHEEQNARGGERSRSDA